jgi:predicted RNase H-like nuclease (RuvC/YqgF family)
MFALLFMQAGDLAAKTLEHAWLVVVGEIVVGAAILVGALAVGKRFLNAEFPGVVREIREDVKHVQEQIEGVRRELQTYRGEVNSLQNRLSEQARDIGYLSKDHDRLDRRVEKLEGDATGHGEQRRPPRRPSGGG